MKTTEHHRHNSSPALRCIVALMVLGCALQWARGADEIKDAPKIYVPYKDIASIVSKTDRAILMNRAEFNKLLASAKAAAAKLKLTDTTPKLGQIARGDYTATVEGENLSLRGDLVIQSLSAEPVIIEIPFGRVGLTEMLLDGKAAPANYNARGRLVLIVTGRGVHKLTLGGSVRLTELSGGGMQFSIALPTAVAGAMKLQLPGDQEAHANVPVAATKYDKQTDRTAVDLTLGGHGSLSVALLGNGRQEDRKAILLGESATTVALTPTGQTMDCLYTVQVLRRGLRELVFTLDRSWTITDVSCPSLVQWSVGEPKGKGPKELTVRLRSATRGTRALHIRASAPMGALSWSSPAVSLVGAGYQRGYVLVDPGDQLAVRAEKLLGARRQDIRGVSNIAGMTGSSGRLYFHWGDKWSVGLQLAQIELKKHSKDRQMFVISPKELSVHLTAEITAVGREMFAVDFVLPGAASGWDLSSVTVNGSKKGFEYRTAAQGLTRLLKLELARPVAPEAVAKINVTLRRVPEKWDWSSKGGLGREAVVRKVTLPLIRCLADKSAGLAAVSVVGDLDAEVSTAAARLKSVTVGKMAPLGLGRGVRAAYTYEAAPDGVLDVSVSRPEPRIAANSVALVSVSPSGVSGRFALTYNVTRVGTRTLYLLTEKSLGKKLTIATPGRQLASRSIVAPGPKSLELPKSVSDAYNLWQLKLDSQARGRLRVRVSYEQALPEGKFSLAMVRPAGAERSTEVLAIEATEELAVTVSASQARDVDISDLPPLPAPARRVLGAFRPTDNMRADGPLSEISLTTAVHENYVIPTALVTLAQFRTTVGADGSQQTRANLKIVNAGLQFLTIELPKQSQLLSVRVGARQAKLKRDAAKNYQVSIPQGRRALDVIVVYATPPNGAGLDDLKLIPVELPGLQINVARWSVIPPSGFAITAHDSDMSPKYPEAMFGPKTAAGELTAAASSVSGKDGMAYGPQVDRADLDSMESADSDEMVQTEGEGVAATGSVRKPADTPARTRKPRPTTKPPAPKADPFSADTRSQGRHTLPVDLVESSYDESEVVFSGLGSPKLTISLTAASVGRGHGWIGLTFVGLIGLCMLNATVKRKVMFVILVGGAATLVTVWIPSLAYAANGGFYAVCLLVLLYSIVGLYRTIASAAAGGKYLARGTALLAVLATLLATGATASAGGEVRGPAVSKTPPVVIPYDGDPTKADTASKVLLPYKRFVKLWNLSHPDRKIELPGSRIVSSDKVSLAGVTYSVVVADKKMNITLQAELTARGKGWAVLPMEISGLAVTTATLAGKPARLQVGPKGMVLAVQAPVSGKFVLTAVTTPKYVGRKGSVNFSLPLLPLAVMKVRLGDPDLELEAPGIDGVLTSEKVGGGVLWTVPLGSARKVALRWSPKAGTGAADRTLSVSATHDIGVFHWALVGVSKMAYSFSAGQNDRFELLIPEGTSITKITGANLRDHRIAGAKTIEGRKFNVVDVRLYRPASKRYDLTAHWIGDLPAMGRPERLWLPRAGRVGREAGYVNLHTAGGMVLKVTGVKGGRRRDIAAPGRSSKGAAVAVLADSTAIVASYQWPYRDFSLQVHISRRQALAKAGLDQLVRVNSDRVQLLVQATITPAGEGGKGGSSRFFGATFNLPDNYELLSVVGPDVEGWHVQKSSGAAAPRRLHVGFRTAVVRSHVAIVLVRDDAKIDRLSVPTVLAVDAGGRVIDDQWGRLAVQVAPALDAHTVSSKLLKSIAPSATLGWLDKRQARAAQFAYRYSKPGIALELAVRKRPTKVRVEIVGGVSVHPASAEYTYRLRYNVSGSPIDRVSFTLPEKYAQLVAVTSRYLRSVSSTGGQAGRKKWTVALTNELTGEFDVLVNFALPIDGSTKKLPVPRVVTGSPDGYRAILAVQNTSRHELAFTPSKSMSPLPVAAQKQILGAEVSKSLQYVYQSFEDNWSAELKIAPAKTASRIQAIVDLMELTTVIDKSGQCRYQVDLSLHNRSEQFLKVALPAGLQLWSARVAGQAVKPVLPSGASGGGGVVHVPLVKTSRGGLPYNVRLYLAGKGTEKVSGIGRISPPSIRIVGVPVKQTTWLLRLPKGFRYIRPEGNMSPISGTAERLSIGIDVNLSQLKRYEKLRKGSYNTAPQEQVFQRNWRYLNDNLTRDIAKNKEFLDNNRRELGEKEYHRLSGKLQDVSTSQFGLEAMWANANKDAQANAGGNVNYFLNGRTTNAGVLEVDRNNTLAVIPEFVRNAGKLQLTNIRNEFAGNAAKLERRRKGGAKPGKSGKGRGGKSKPGLGISTGKFLALDDNDKDGELKKVTEALAGEQDRLLVMRQGQLEKQVKDLGDNRLERYFGRLNTASGQRLGQGQGQGEGQGQARGPGQNGQQQNLGNITLPRVPGQTTGTLNVNGGVMVGGGILSNGDTVITSNDFTIAGNVNGGTITLTDGSFNYETVSAGDTGGGGAQPGGGRAAAGGMFSLPVELPDSDGEVLDFAYPGGDPQVSVLAVPADIWRAGASTITITIVLAVLLLGVLLIQKMAAKSRKTGVQ
ncbi:MAG: hypothetical protein QGH60_07505 [Phycisphaerae bacterium]|nr:hypothetical protein [Phycisphaerae bacterium]